MNKCKGCSLFVRNNDTLSDGGKTKLGECHAHSPGGDGGWPTVWDFQMCGEFEQIKEDDRDKLIIDLVSFIQCLSDDGTKYITPGKQHDEEWFINKMISKLDGPRQRGLFARARGATQ